MISQYHYITANGVECKPSNLVDGIGIEQFKKWKRTEKLFKVCDALTMADFAVYAYGTCFSSKPKDIPTAKKLSKMHWDIYDSCKRMGIDHIFIGTIYSLNRNIDIQAWKGQYVATRSCDKFDSEHGIYGIGHDPLLAAADLHRQLTIEKIKTFIP